VLLGRRKKLTIRDRRYERLRKLRDANANCKSKLQNTSLMISRNLVVVVANKRPSARENFLDDIQISDDGDNAHLHSTTKDKG